MWKSIFAKRYGLLLMTTLAMVALPCRLASAQASAPRKIVHPSTKAQVGKQTLDAALDRYVKETEASLASRMAELQAFFDERKAGSPAFAESMLGIEGKLMVGTGAAQDLFDAATGKVNKPSALKNNVGDRFRSDVIDPSAAKQAADAAIAGFLGDIASSEGRLLVGLKADIGDDELVIPASLPELGSFGKTQFDAVIGSTIDAVITDIGVSVGMFVASNYVSSKIVDEAAPKDASGGAKFIANFLLGLAVDKALEEAAKQAGYEPQKKLAATVDSGIDRIRQLLIDGDPAVAVFYTNLKIFRRMHPQASVRDACGRAEEAVKRNANPGLRERLRGLRNERYRRLWVVLTGQIVGAEAAKSPFLMYEPLDAKKASPPDAIIRWADGITAIYGGAKR